MTSSAGPCLEEDDDGDELDEFCSLKYEKPAEPPSSESSSTIPLLSQLPPPIAVDGNPNRRSFWTSCLKYVVDPRRIFHRCLLHLLICLYIPGAYFADSVLAAYKTQILEYLRIDHERFALLFSLPSLTGVLCGPFGVMVAKYGSTKSALSAATLTCVGSALVVVGLQNRAYSVVLFGRVVFWTFLYILCVVQTVLCYRLFSGSALVAAYGLIIVACRTGGLMGSAFNAVLLSWYQGDVVKATKTTSGPESTDLRLTPTLKYPREFDLASVTCMLVVDMSLISFSSALAAVGLVCAIAFAVLYKGTRTARLVWPLLSRRDVATSELSTFNATQRYSLKTLPALYWVLWLALGLLYAAIFPFETIAVDYYVGDWGMTQQRAGMILSTCPFWSLLSPLFSIVLTSIKRKTRTLLLAFTFITIGLVGQAMRLTASPLGFMILTGWGYALGGTCAWVLASDILSAANCRSPPIEAAAVAMLYVSLGVMLFISSYVAGVLHYSALKGSLSVVRSDDDDSDDEGIEAGDDLSEETDETPSREWTVPAPQSSLDSHASVTELVWKVPVVVVVVVAMLPYYGILHDGR
ncbi:Major facilitator super domain-containing protein 1 [Perkinsus olseni]|uniref:Major facilitator super domain-containing protein 1 n=1 Tax=Perkinsus olseni TaxID=32597 RepID=A0A7J6LQH6_PEROL|nr:Major facilitator super domain-containing protein 1 [Perkinsus olseni]